MHTNMLFGLPDLKHSTLDSSMDAGAVDDDDDDDGKNVGGNGDGGFNDATDADSLQVCFAIAFSTLFGSRFFFSTFSPT